MKQKDIYDSFIERLTDDPEHIAHSWCRAEPLFKVVGEAFDREENIYSGCLTQIRADKNKGAFIKGEFNEELTRQIREDTRIPQFPSEITPENLFVFAEWQRKIDQLENH